MKNLKKMLREQSDQILPDDRVKENIRRQLGMAPQPQTEAVFAHDSSTTRKHGKKTLVAVLAAFLALALLLGILLPVLLNKKGSPGNNPLGKFPSVLSSENFYIYGAASVGSLLASNSAAQRTGAAASVKSLSLSPSLIALAADDSLSDKEQTIVDTVNNYLALVENLLGDGSIDHSDPQKPDGVYAEYEFYTVISYKDLLGNRVSYLLYYNETPLSSAYKKDETEENFSIDGILVVEGVPYPVSGTRGVESETEGSHESETENELEFTAYLNENRSSFIRMQQKTESETENGETESEQEFEYTYYENGKRVESTSVSYETEGEELELKMTVQKAGSEKDEIVFELDNADSALRVRARIQGEETSFFIRIVLENGTTRYRYEFSGGHSMDEDRWDDDDDDDDDHGRRPF